jgi:hypothetical protein
LTVKVSVNQPAPAVEVRQFSLIDIIGNLEQEAYSLEGVTITDG